MGKADGFIKFDRRLPTVQPVDERIKHFNDFTSLFDSEQLNIQSSRCMDCGTPFCQSGCPLGNNIPDFNEAVYREQWQKAWQILSATNNFPEFTGRICPAPCESACVLDIQNKPIAIEAIEKQITEQAFSLGLIQPLKPYRRTGKKVAVIGSGPAGLAAAAQLNYTGHYVTVFEREKLAGGLLRYGIPDFKLEKWVIDRRIKLMELEGIEFKCGIEAGTDISILTLKQSYDAIILAIGSTVARDQEIPGRHLDGIYYAMDYLKNQNQLINKEVYSSSQPEINAAGKHVIVIGGGDTGSDCIGTAIRQGAQSVTQLDYHTRPPLERPSSQPWPMYPSLFRTSSSQEEGCTRLFKNIVQSFSDNGSGHVNQVQISEVEIMESTSGKRQIQQIAGTERWLNCDLALLAIGFIHPEHTGITDHFSLQLDAKGLIATSSRESYKTSADKVFTCGDARRGQSLVVWAIAEGRSCAREVDEFLMTVSDLPDNNSDPVSMLMRKLIPKHL